MGEALFQYNIRVSMKAKNPRLKVTLRDGLEVVVPKGYDQTKVSGLLDKKNHWIRAALERVEQNRKFLRSESEWNLPATITLTAIGGRWHLESRESSSEKVVMREVSPNRLLIFGNIGDEKACVAALRRWLHRKAKSSLVSILENVSERMGLRCSRVFVKQQRTRWASCSRNRTISLNAKLLFLEPELVEYCMAHELCHVEEMNHSRKFWSLVRHHLPDYRNQDRLLRDAWKKLPRWAH